MDSCLVGAAAGGESLARFEGGGTTSGVLTSASAMSVTSGERAVLDSIS